MFEKIKEFFKDVRGEIKKITFPTKEETVSSTIVVIIFVIVVAIFLSFTDIGLTKLVKVLIK